MAECTRNIELFYLLGKLTPDFRTIADFRKDNTKAIKNVFRVFVKLIPIPENLSVNLFNHMFDWKDYAPARKVVLRIKKDIHKAKERMCLSEHSFGTVK